MQPHHKGEFLSSSHNNVGGSLQSVSMGGTSKARNYYLQSRNNNYYFQPWTGAFSVSLGEETCCPGGHIVQWKAARAWDQSMWVWIPLPPLLAICYHKRYSTSLSLRGERGPHSSMNTNEQVLAAHIQAPGTTLSWIEPTRGCGAHFPQPCWQAGNPFSSGRESGTSHRCWPFTFWPLGKKTWLTCRDLTGL